MIYLASKSPRRQELLQQIGIDFELVAVEIDESPLPGESAESYVKRMAIEKSSHAWQDHMNKPLLSADTTVVVEGNILGKPTDEADFKNMMKQLSGQTHKVMTAIAVTLDGKTDSKTSISEVSFRHLTEMEIHRYWQSGEPHDKAGGYAVQGLGAIFIEQISGSYSGIMGLPLFETAELLQAFGVTVPEQHIMNA